jgi:hypothetical protein
MVRVFLTWRYRTYMAYAEACPFSDLIEWAIAFDWRSSRHVD